MKSYRKLPRRERCEIIGRRGQKLQGIEAQIAWRCVCRRVEILQDKDIPKFEDLLSIIRAEYLHQHRRPPLGELLTGVAEEIKP